MGCQDACIHKTGADFVCLYGKRGSFQAPVGQINHISRRLVGSRDIIPEVIRCHKIKLRLAKRTGQKTVGLIDDDGCTALRTLVLDFPVEILIFYHNDFNNLRCDGCADSVATCNPRATICRILHGSEKRRALSITGALLLYNNLCENKSNIFEEFS